MNLYFQDFSPRSILKVFIFLYLLIVSIFTQAQRIGLNASDSALRKDIKYPINYKNQRDLIDFGYKILGKNPNHRVDSSGKKTRKIHFAGSPGIEYSLTTGIAGNLYGNFAYYTSEDGKTNLSSFLIGIGYTQKKQFYIPIQSSIWTKNNQYNFIGDWRFDRFPQDTYGFGNLSKLSDGYTLVDYRIRIYELALKHIAEDFYIGAGYEFDRHWGIKELLDSTTRIPTDFENYGLEKASTSSGLAINILYDTRRNSINPVSGAVYGSILFLQNFTFLGSETNWNSLNVDIRKYFGISPHSLLAFWSYNYITLSGHPPYLDLPGTATDTYRNTGRGYVQNRFIGKNMIDLETEYRFGILKNGFLGGVVFGNAQSQSTLLDNRFKAISLGYGFGLRIKFNKFSKTNICLDYGIGQNGSHGIFANLGEVF